MTSSCASCAFLRSRLESQSWNSFNSFPDGNEVSAGADSARLQQTLRLRTSKLAQKCGKTEILHLQPSYAIYLSHEIETLPPNLNMIHLVLNILWFLNRMILNSGRRTQSDGEAPSLASELMWLVTFFATQILSVSCGGCVLCGALLLSSGRPSTSERTLRRPE